MLEEEVVLLVELYVEFVEDVVLLLALTVELDVDVELLDELVFELRAVVAVEFVVLLLVLVFDVLLLDVLLLELVFVVVVVVDHMKLKSLSVVFIQGLHISAPSDPSGCRIQSGLFPSASSATKLAAQTRSSRQSMRP